MLKLKRAYDTPEPGDGKRILVDRLWPRGISKTIAHLDGWMKELAPSDELRKWFGHDDTRWEEFRKRYILELKSPEKVKLIHDLRVMVEGEPITLVYGAKDVEHNNGVVLKQFIEEIMEKKSSF